MRITAQTNGPLIVDGETELVDQSGRAYSPRNPTKFALCRCGGSSKKPFCDGSHARNGFQCAAQRTDGALSDWEGDGGSLGAESHHTDAGRYSFGQQEGAPAHAAGRDGTGRDGRRDGVVEQRGAGLPRSPASR